MKTSQPITIISFGAATPEDISIRAYDKPQKADEIYRLGEVAYRILTALPEGSALVQRCQILEVPISSDRTEVISYYEQSTTRLIEQQGRGLVCSIVTVGDAGTHAMVWYLTDQLRRAGAKVEIVPGIPYHIAAVTVFGGGLVRQDESLLVLSRVFSSSQLREGLSKGVMAVVTKLSCCAGIVREVMAGDNYDFIYAEHLGNPDLELLTSGRDMFLSRQPISYPSLTVIRSSRSISK